jgi:DNA-binding PadR family transcriptional regulator
MSKHKLFTTSGEPLTPAIFYILLSLSIKPRHGYDIMKQVSADSQRKIKLGPGTLYGAIKRLLAEGLIRESDERPDEDDERRRYYDLTEKGRVVLGKELERFSEALTVAKKGNILRKLSIKLAI